MKFITLGPLRALLTPEFEPVDLGLTVVLLHGYGAPGTDLVGLAAELDVPVGTRFVFLQGPLSLEPGAPDDYAPRAWWPIDMARLQFLRMSGRHDELTSAKPAGLDEARQQLVLAIEALERDHGLSRERLVIGGFSQGAMLATDFALREPGALAGLVILSGTLLTEKDWLQLLPGRSALPVFQSHSPDDQVLPYQLATRLAAHWTAAGAPHRFVEFRGGHGIGPSVLAGLGTFLHSLSA